MIIHLPQLLPGNEANQHSHCTCVHSEQIFVSYICLYLKYQCFYFITFLNKTHRFLSHRSAESSLSRPAFVTPLPEGKMWCCLSHRISCLSSGSVHTPAPRARCWYFPLLRSDVWQHISSSVHTSSVSVVSLPPLERQKLSAGALTIFEARVIIQTPVCLWEP